MMYHSPLCLCCSSRVSSVISESDVQIDVAATQGARPARARRISMENMQLMRITPDKVSLRVTSDKVSASGAELGLA